MRPSFGVIRLLPWTLLVLSSNAMPSKRAESGSVQYLITFGDSYSQTGFNITGTQPSPANPLGNPRLPGWTASGGLNWVGHLVSVLNTSTLLSYNFAYGGATTNATLVKPWRDDVLSLVDQVSLFTGSIGAAPPRDPVYAVGWTGANALFGVWMGVNDVGNSWWLSDQETHLGQIMDTYFSQMQRLYDAGARQFALLTVPPIHKTPSVLAQPEQNRAQEAAVIQQYNNMLASRAKAFGAANSGVTLKIVDTGAPFDEAIANPTKYGAPDATCFNGDGKSCLWFNDYHPGIAINKLVADAVVAAWKGVFFRTACKG